MKKESSNRSNFNHLILYFGKKTKDRVKKLFGYMTVGLWILLLALQILIIHIINLEIKFNLQEYKYYKDKLCNILSKPFLKEEMIYFYASLLIFPFIAMRNKRNRLSGYIKYKTFVRTKIHKAIESEKKKINKEKFKKEEEKENCRARCRSIKKSYVCRFFACLFCCNCCKSDQKRKNRKNQAKFFRFFSGHREGGGGRGQCIPSLVPKCSSAG